MCLVSSFKLLVLQLDGERMSHTYTTTRLRIAAPRTSTYAYSYTAMYNPHTSIAGRRKYI